MIEKWSRNPLKNSHYFSLLYHWKNDEPNEICHKSGQEADHTVFKQDQEN